MFASVHIVRLILLWCSLEVGCGCKIIARHHGDHFLAFILLIVKLQLLTLTERVLFPARAGRAGVRLPGVLLAEGMVARTTY